MPTRGNEEGLHTQSISGPHMHRIAKRLKTPTTTTKQQQKTQETCGALLDSAFGCCKKVPCFKSKTMLFCKKCYKYRKKGK